MGNDIILTPLRLEFCITQRTGAIIGHGSMRDRLAHWTEKSGVDARELPWSYTSRKPELTDEVGHSTHAKQAR